METTLIAAQALTTGLVAAWLTLGVRDNILHPSINETFTAEVMEMTRMRQDFPETFAQVAHRAVSDRRIHQVAFQSVVIAELATTLVLWAGVVALLLGVAGTVTVETGRTVALVGGMMFTAIWAGFLITGNHFSYWLCHESAQNTHYQMTLWGVGTMILLGLG